jgi:hypothetical protein
MPEFIDIEKFRKDGELQKEETPGLRKYYCIEEVKGIEETADGLAVPFVISTESIDRDGDVIQAAGWELDNYRKNPVVLFAHNYANPPVAKSLGETIVGKKLKSIALFMPKEVSAFAFMIGNMYAKGFMRAVSVGFIGKKWAFAKDKDRPLGIDFEKQELLEYSAVPVPANAEALLDAKGAGIDISPMLDWAIETLDKADYTDKETAEKVYGLLETKKSFLIPKSALRPAPVGLYKNLISNIERRNTYGLDYNDSRKERGAKGPARCCAKGKSRIDRG